MDDSRDSPRGTSPGHAQILRFRKAAPAAPGQASELSAGELFGVLWRALAEILGTAATATLLRRAAQRAEPRWPELSALSITRDGLDYRYAVPPVWEEPVPTELEALRELAAELRTLLVDLTGSVVVHRLAQVPELRDRGIVLPWEQQP